jgi:tRNA-modifying protein YgfZ
MDSVFTAQQQTVWRPMHTRTWLTVTGNDRLDYFQRVTTNDVASLQPFKGKQTVVVTDKGRIVDVVLLVAEDKQTYVLGSAASASMLKAWFKKYIIADDVRVVDTTESVGCIEVIGPNAHHVLSELTGVDAHTLANLLVGNHITEHELRIVRIPSISELSFVVVAAIDILDTLQETLKLSSDTVPVCTTPMYETARILSGMGTYGAEWTNDYNPLEAGLLHTISFTKGCYIGQEVIARLDTYNKVQRRLVGVASRKQLSINEQLVRDAQPIGIVTSVAPHMVEPHGWVALAYVRGEHASHGSTLETTTGIPAVLHHLPFDV